MKPKEKIEKQIKEKACSFASSTRGQYIIGKALAIAFEQLNAVKGIHREESDMDDMQYLIDNLFEMGAMCYAIENGKGGKA